MHGICSCCLELPCLKNIWSQYVWMGQDEIYGQMLKDCFNLSWPRTDQSKDQICEVCITLLRSAVQFKQRIIQNQAKIERKLDEMKFTYSETEMFHNENQNTFTSSSDMNCNVDYDDDICDVSEANEDGKRRILSVPKKLKERQNIEIRKNNYIKPRQNACLLLEHSSIVPFKSSKGYFACLYCNKQHVGFDELKSHIMQSHVNIGFKSILKSISRPNDRIKVDVSNITCKICETKFDNLEMLVPHLTDHNVKFNFDDAVKPIDSILPFYLSDNKFKCYICKTEFLFFKTLTNHMNTHSNDHVCDVCGKCFLLPERLKAHIQMHTDWKTAKCDYCGKVCTSNLTLRSHIRYTHKKLSYMCSICNENFVTFKLRMKHFEEVHKQVPLNLNCIICSKKYRSPKSLNSHMRTEHLKIQREHKHGCDICSMTFKSRFELISHSIVHSNEKKFECEVCHKKYARSKTLTEHLKIHRNDRRWSCGACSHSFIQKCSLKNHIRVHHVDVVNEKLMVYKKPEE